MIKSKETAIYWKKLWIYTYFVWISVVGALVIIATILIVGQRLFGPRNLGMQFLELAGIGYVAMIFFVLLIYIARRKLAEIETLQEEDKG
jgi:hypothetical protein